MIAGPLWHSLYGRGNTPISIVFLKCIHSLCVCLYFLLFKKLVLFYFFIFGCAGSSLLYGFFSRRGERGLLSSCGARASHCGGFFVAERGGLSARGLHSCSSWELEYRLRAVRASLRCMGLAAPWHVGSSWIRGQTRVSCIGWQIL